VAPESVDQRAPALVLAAAPRGKAKQGAVRLHTEPITGVRFPVPAAGVSVEARHFDASLPEYKFKHSIRLKTDTGTRVLIDVWNNPAGLALNAWFADHFSYLVDDHTQVGERLMTRAGLTGILLQEPASEQAASQIIAVFAFRDQVFRVTGLDPEGDAATRELFDRVVDQIELGVAQ
jgi:hypothetical protein